MDSISLVKHITDDEIIYDKYCPYNYCCNRDGPIKEISLSLQLNVSGGQCNHNRSRAGKYSSMFDFMVH